MGGSSSKTDRPVDRFDSTVEKAVCEMFGVLKKDEIPRITTDMVHGVWVRELDPALMKTLMKHLFGSGVRKEISFEKFTSFYLRLNKSGTRHEALVELILLYSPQITLAGIELFVKELLMSYYRVLREHHNAPMASWNDIHVKTTRETTSAVVKFLCRDLDKDNQALNGEELDKWFQSATIVMSLMEDVLNAAYNISFPDFHSGLLPEAVRQPKHQVSNYDECSTLLDLSEVVVLCSWLPSDFTSRWRLLFSTSLHGDSWSSLLKYLVAQGPTLIIIEEHSGEMFGAFASSSWKLYPQFYGNDYCFLFTLKPHLERFDPSGYNRNFQYLNTGQSTLPNGLGMGGQMNYWGLFISSEFGQGEVSNTCTTFKDYQPLASKNSFNFRNLEVWGVGNPDPLPEDMGERRERRGILETDLAAEAILEMAGRKVHSRGIREQRSS